jgi:hypothetical protein
MDKINYIYAPTKQFSEHLEKIKLTDHLGYKRIIKVIDRLLINPNDADGKMHGLYNGRLKKYVGRSGYRLIYYWCELCHKENHRLKIACEDCGNISDKSIVFLHLYHKKNKKIIK